MATTSESKANETVPKVSRALVLPSLLGVIIGVVYDGINGTYIKVNLVWNLLFVGVAILLVFFALRHHYKQGRETGLHVMEQVVGFILMSITLLMIGDRTLQIIHGVPYGYAYLVRAVAGCFGISATSGINIFDGNVMIYFSTPFGFMPVSLSSEKLVMSVLTVTLVWALMSSIKFATIIRRLQFFLVVTGVVIIWEAIRFVLLGYLVVAHNIRPDVFWDPFITVVSFIPMTLLLDLVVQYFHRGEKQVIGRNRGLLSFVVFGLLSLFILVFWYVPGGEKKNGTVLIDDSHSNWEWSDLPFNEETFKEQEMYSSSAFRYLLSCYWNVKVNSKVPLDQISLTNYSVLVLKTPTRQYSEAEAEAVRQFVSNGGGLLMLGDHTDLFGMGNYLNRVAKPFHIRFNYDDQFLLTVGRPTTYDRSSFWCHPVVKNMDHFEFLTSCTLSAPLCSDLIVGNGMGVEPLDYAHVNFFGNIKTEVDENWGDFVQMAAVEYGRGKVIAFADSTCMSTFCLFFDTKPALWVRTVDFLNRSSNSFVSTVFHGLKSFGLVCLLGMFILCLLRPLPEESWLFIGIGALSLIHVCGVLSWQNYPMPEREAVKTVVFDSEKSAFQMPSMVDFSPEDAKNAYALDSFFLSFFRLGYEPYVNNPLELTNSPLLKVIINPRTGVFGNAECQKLINTISAGGKVLILANFDNVNVQDSLHALLNKAGKRMIVLQQSVSHCPFFENSHRHYDIQISEGDDGFSCENDANLNVHRIHIGKGVLYLVGGTDLLSRAGLGPVYNLNMTDDERQAYKIVYALIRYILENGSEASVKNATTDYLAIRNRMHVESIPNKTMSSHEGTHHL